jgi:hypothetical protein
MRENQHTDTRPKLTNPKIQWPERVFVTIKRQWGYDHILLKGLWKNEGEFGLI